jgi:hypothetical protein
MGWDPGGVAAARETTAGSPQGETPWEGANQHDAFEDAEWAHQAGCGVDHDAGAGGGADCAGRGVQSDFDRSGTEGLGSPQDEQPKVGL